MSIIEILEMAGYSAADLFKRGTSIGDDHDFFLEKKIDDRNNLLLLSYE